MEAFVWKNLVLKIDSQKMVTLFPLRMLYSRQPFFFKSENPPGGGWVWGQTPQGGGLGAGTGFGAKRNFFWELALVRPTLGVPPPDPPSPGS